MARRTLIPLLVMLVFTAEHRADAIKIPNLLSAMQRSKQKRTMADIRTVATAWEVRAIDTHTYALSAVAISKTRPKATVTMNAAATFTWPRSRITYDQLKATLVPTFIKTLPQKDGWGHDLEFAVIEATSTSPLGGYAIRSPGKDGVFDGTSYAIGTISGSLNADLVFANGSFVQWHESVQR